MARRPYRAHSPLRRRAAAPKWWLRPRLPLWRAIPAEAERRRAWPRCAYISPWPGAADKPSALDRRCVGRLAVLAVVDKRSDGNLGRELRRAPGVVFVKMRDQDVIDLV